MAKADQRRPPKVRRECDNGSTETLQRAHLQLQRKHEDLLKLHGDLKHSQSRYQDLFNAAPVGYLTTDVRGRIEEANHAAAALFAVAPALLIGREVPRLLIGADRVRLRQLLQHLRLGEVSCPLEVRRLGRSGIDLPVQIVVLRSLKNDAHELRFVLFDLTEIKTVERQLAEARDVLERRFDERAQELERANLDITEQMAHTAHLESRLLAISERERRRFGQDLHDDTCQALSGLAMQLTVLFRRLHKDGVELAPEFHALALDLNNLVNHTRRIAHGLHPLSLVDGLPSALQALAAGLGGKLKCSVKAVSAKNLPPDVALALYRIAQEALANAVKHSRASRVTISLREEASRLTLSIEDNGVGLPKEAPPQGEQKGGMGLDILGYRARSIGGQLLIENLPRRGVRVACCVRSFWKQADGTKPGASSTGTRDGEKDVRALSGHPSGNGNPDSKLRG